MKATEIKQDDHTVVLTEKEKKAADEGLNSLANEKTILHAEVISYLKKKYPTLKFN